MIAEDVYRACINAMERGSLINRANANDKEFHFQNWIKDRIIESGLAFDEPGRNSFPDFRIVNHPVGFEVKGLAYPGRENSYDGNSQIPKGSHNTRSIYYIFGRYPSKPDGNSYPVIDLIVCTGDFLNADSAYIHKNKSIRGFGSYGDILIRDRKMYVIPTPYALADGLAHFATLILPFDDKLNSDFTCVGELSRKETNECLKGYSFDLTTNNILAEKIPNPNAGKEHQFKAWRLSSQPNTKVTMRPISEVIAEIEHAAEKQNYILDNE
jgi:hypothetical protein